MINSLKPAVVVAVAISLMLVGCASSTPAPKVNSSVDSGTSDGGSAEETPTESSVPPATGEQLAGDGFSFNVPEGWGVPEGVPAGEANVFAADLADSDEFADNVNVVAAMGGEITPDQIESTGVEELSGAGATNVEFRERVTVAGTESAHLSATFSTNGFEYLVDQFYLNHEGQTFVVTFSFSPTVAATDRDAIAQSVLASWEWA